MSITNYKGDIGEAAFVLAAAKKGYWVGKMPQDCPYDFVLDTGLGPKRVQIKFRSLTKTGTIQLKLENNTFTNRRSYTEENIDAFVVYIPDVEELFYIPISKIGNLTEVTFRYHPPKNGMTAGIRFISEFKDW